ncbi:MAG: DUF3830 family protein [Anaerolineales bacterium]|nr:MAG: DUF3830 family protein [Anaerolineales bacterium]
MLPSKIRFILERGGELVADLLPEAAPKTIERVLEVLPHETTVYHTRWCGREINFPIKSIKPVLRENQTATASTGDVVYWKEWETEENPPEALAIYYGAEVIRDHRGFLPVNLFARISQDQWPQIEEIGIRVWQKGIEKIHIEVVED